MKDERLDHIRARCAQLGRRMPVEGPWWLLDWCLELLDELERWRPRQARLPGTEEAA